VVVNHRHQILICFLPVRQLIALLYTIPKSADRPLKKTDGGINEPVIWDGLNLKRLLD
jgi:hypothetical protein